MDPEETYEMLTKGIKRAFKKTAKFVDSMEQKIKISLKKADNENEDLTKF